MNIQLELTRREARLLATALGEITAQLRDFSTDINTWKHLDELPRDLVIFDNILEDIANKVGDPQLHEFRDKSIRELTQVPNERDFSTTEAFNQAYSEWQKLQHDLAEVFEDRPTYSDLHRAVTWVIETSHE